MCLRANFDPWEKGDGGEMTDVVPALSPSCGLFQGTISFYGMSCEVPACQLDTPAKQLFLFWTQGGVWPFHSYISLHCYTSFLDSPLLLGFPNKA